MLNALEHLKSMHIFHEEIASSLIARNGWPEDVIYTSDSGSRRRRICPAFCKALAMAVKLQKLSTGLDVTAHVEKAVMMRDLDRRRTGIATRIQQLAEDLVSCRVVAELSRTFSAEAQSALVKFAQVSGKARFGKSSAQSQASKMTQRQRRKRKEYLDAFEKCVRYIPCWILTSAQISDYLPAECLFDLVVIDEASQSDVTVLPGMLRGKQWLIVGDGKQVSPTESFVSEEQIEMLKSAIPESPFEDSMLPGHSFFDLCAQAFPKGRVILREHFRCAPEIIQYSNSEFYNGNLTPLRLPRSSERLKPSLIDVRVPRGRKIGKVNEEECDEIVRMIAKYIETCTLVQKRSIGVISLVGEEQSRLIRGRLLDRIGPHKYKLHNILVGEPPSFQGAERDIVFLSLVCSPGAIVTQSQLMHFQRANVALSRARDRMVLVRSFDTNHIPNSQDIKFSILDFFERSQAIETNGVGMTTNSLQSSSVSPFRSRAEQALRSCLIGKGYSIQRMGVVWDNALCVEDGMNGAARAALYVEASGESKDDWRSMLQQQKSIERVGWRCMRLDAISFLTNYQSSLNTVIEFLDESGVSPGPKVPQEVARQEESAIEIQSDDNESISVARANNEEAEQVVAISSEDDEASCTDDRKPSAVPTLVRSDPNILDDGEAASNYGLVANLDFLGFPAGGGTEDDERPRKRRRVASSNTPGQLQEANDLEEKQRVVSESTRQTFSNDDLSLSSSEERGTPMELASAAPSRASKSARRRRTRLDKYSRDGRWYPSRRKSNNDDDVTLEEYIEEVVPEPSTQAKSGDLPETDERKEEDAESIANEIQEEDQDYVDEDNSVDS